MDNSIEHLLRLIALFARATGKAISTVSRMATGSGDTVRRLSCGGRITTDRAARAARYLSDHWPANLEWPADIPRPNPQTDREAA